MERGHVKGPTTKAQVECIATVGWNGLGAISQDMEIAIRGDLPKNLWKHPWKKKIFSISLLGKGRIKQIVLSLKKEQSSCPSLPLPHTSLIQREEGGKEGEASMKREGVIRLLSYRQVAL